MIGVMVWTFLSGHSVWPLTNFEGFERQNLLQSLQCQQPEMALQLQLSTGFK